MIRICTFSPEDTMNLGEKIGRLLKGGEVICLTGDLGAGKTHFAKGVARGLGVSETVTSPTFTLIHEYSGRLPLYHVDAYRLWDPDEAYDLGLEEYLYGDGVTLLEWPERISELLPPEYMTVEISRADESDENDRDIEITAGPGYEEMLRILAEELTQADVCIRN